VTREEAWALLEGYADVSYDLVDEVFRAFGFRSRTPSWDTEVYFHPLYPDCGMFTARDDGFHVLTPEQRGRVKWMVARAKLQDDLNSQRKP
jgi:hypothetical protein